jgi:transposase
VPPDAKSYRVTKDRAGRWHVAFAVIPAPVPAPGNGQVVGIDRGVAVAAALFAGELLCCPGLTARERARLRARESDRRKDWAEKTSTGHADVNAAINIAAGLAVTARGGDGIARPVNCEPQLLLPSA